DLARVELDLRAGGAVLRERRAQRLAQAKSAFDFDRIERADGSPLAAVCEVAARVARHDLSVLVLGESGTGKELLARAIHYASPRAGGAFVVENCAAIPDTLLESELFGHKRGAFTGAVDDHVGLFQRAHGGTIFLDEIGETSAAFQVKLLRVLQEGEVRPVGSTRALPVDVRVVAATHRPLEEDMRAGRFRADLYYRLAGVTLAMPPLRERAGDVAPIARRLLAEVGAELGLPGLDFDDDVLPCLMAYPWPGNVRELRNEIARAVALADGERVPARAFSARVLRGRSGEAVAAQATSHSPIGLRVQGKPALHKVDVFLRGEVEVQDEGSQLIALAVGARRGEMVADFCAGGGGKTLALGAAMRNTGRLYAFDISGHRLAG
ncbi:MAG TPA: sigma 54-interacting transcriptional regulator, partial [Rubrivivax sp.]|nr:sigma 54-interacting transcriptional regulator [Rubrivivax sp.]